MNVKVNNYQTDYLQKTIILKDDQIKELLEELRQTQELHQNLKKKYMGQEQVLREKLKKFQNIVDELKKENEDLTMKFKRTVKEKNTSDGQLEIVSKQWDSAITEINDNMLKLRYENEMLLKENRLLKEQNHKIKQQHEKLAKEVVSLNEKLMAEKEEFEKVQKQIAEKENQWQREYDELTKVIEELQEETVEKKERINNDRLQELQEKVRTILIQF